MPATFVAFDLLFLDGHSLLDLPYEERRERLEELDLNGAELAHAAFATRARGGRCYEASKQQGLEGVVAKRLDSPYAPGRRSSAWIKVKHKQQETFVVGGYLPGQAEGRRGAARPARRGREAPLRRSRRERAQGVRRRRSLLTRR